MGNALAAMVAAIVVVIVLSSIGLACSKTERKGTSHTSQRQ
jgi:hypothetical protein